MPTTARSRRRTRPRVEDTEADKKVTKNTKHRSFEAPTGFISLNDSEIYIGAQLSELVPVAQYASVTLGPVQVAWKLGGVDMEALLDVDWSAIEDSDDLESTLTKPQREAWQRARNGLRATMMLIEFTIAEDRETVERSVREHNERESEKKKSGR